MLLTFRHFVPANALGTKLAIAWSGLYGLPSNKFKSSIHGYGKRNLSMAHIYITPKAQLIYSYILLTIFRKLLLLNTIFVKHHIWPTCVRRCSSFFLISFFHRQTFPPSDSAHVTSHLRNVLRTYLVLCYPQVVAGYSPPSHNNNTALCLEP